MLRMAVCWSVVGFVLLGTWGAVWALDIPIANDSFEGPAVVPGGFPAVPMVDQWIEIDQDTEGSTNTGVFANSPAGSDDHVANADGTQLAFLGSERGNALEQDLEAVFQPGRAYQLTLAVGISALFPPSGQEPVDTLELVLYYVQDGNAVDVASLIIPASDLSSTQLQDFSLYLPEVSHTDDWAGQTMGVAIRAAGLAGGFWDLDRVRLSESLPVSLAIANASFEAPAVDPNAFPAFPLVDAWLELDQDALGSTNTGVFTNTSADSDDHVVNAVGRQLAFLGSEQGNALEQDLTSVYQVGCDYRLTVAVGVSSMFAPSVQDPIDTLDLTLYYVDDTNAIDIVTQTVPATGLSSTLLQDFSVHLPAVLATDVWAGKHIGVAIRATGLAGGFWDLDHVRLIECMPGLVPLANASFEAPAVDPNAFPALPMVDQWIEADLDVMGSTNTGVFANTPVPSDDHIVNADGRQLAFLGSEQGNALDQVLDTVYQVGSTYRLTVAVGVSGRFPPAAQGAVDTLEMVLYYIDGADSVDIMKQVVPATDLSSTRLQDFSVYLTPVGQDDPWAGKTVGVGLRAAGLAGGFWDLDHVRLAQATP